jgi:nucleotide-binding universal stress UspA family protein
MKAVIGIGFMEQCLVGARLFADMKFPDASAVLVHTVEPVLPDGGFMPETSTSPIVEIQRQRKQDGERRMGEAAKDLQARGVTCTTVTAFGNPAHEITALAEKESADMVVAGSGRKGALESFVMGSVTRALVIEAKRSILVGKREAKGGDKIDAVFATDHSDYANTCVDHLVRLAPQGLGKITVVSADTTDENIAAVLAAEGRSPDEILTSSNTSVAKKLQSIATETDSVVLRGRVGDVITAAMEQSRADLLIIGAHGHGFLERLLIGSTAMQMVGNSPWNVLVVRV